MKRITTLLLLSLILTNTIWANPIDPEKAGAIAKDFWNGALKQPNTEVLTLKSPAGMAKAGSRIKIKENEPQYYIYTAKENNGFVIVSGDDALSPIVGYSTENIDENSDMPTVLVEWLNEYSQYVDDVRAGKITPAQRGAKAGKRAVAPMLQTTWDQTSPYNNLCPEVNGQKTPTGCTATAMAQIMKFHEWPITPLKMISWESNITGKTETIDLTKRTYNWDNMLPHYRNGYTAEQAQEVAQLMVDVGKAIHSSYSPGGTGSNEAYAANAFVNVFDYSKAIRIIKRVESTEEEYVKAIRDNLEARQPVLYIGIGANYTGGHAFVCDGIDENDMLHIDWGWNGAFNGYFDMTYMSPDGIGTGGGTGMYNVAQAIIVNIAPSSKSDVNSSAPGLIQFGIYQPNTETELYTYTTKFTDNLAKFRVSSFIINFSHSTLKNIEFALAAKKSDGTYKILEYDKYEGEDIKFYNYIPYFFDFSITPNTLEKGTHELKIVYRKSNKEEYTDIISDHNSLMLDVNENSATLRRTLPDIQVSSLELTTPNPRIGSSINFNAKFINNNTYNSTVLVVPVVNTTLPDGSVVRDTLKNARTLFDVYDNREIFIEFNTSGQFKHTGDCNITFAYNLFNHYLDNNLTFNSKKAESVKGKSSTFAIKEEEPGGSPTLTKIYASDITNGGSLNVTAIVTNQTYAGYSYTGTLALVLRNINTNQAYTVAEETVTELGKNKTVTLNYNSSDYFPTLPTGSYEVMVYEVKDGKIEPIPQLEKGTFNINEGTNIIPFINGKTSVCYEDIVAGDSVDVHLIMNSYNGTFDGYVRINTSSGITAILRSSYIPVTLAEGENTELDIACICGSKATMGKWPVIIKYYDKNKRELGTVSNNLFTYPGNGYFWVGDGTDIEKVENVGSVTISTGNGGITITDAVEAQVTIYGADGREVYKGTDSTIQVAKGLYIVTVQQGGTTTATKVYVK